MDDTVLLEQFTDLSMPGSYGSKEPLAPDAPLLLLVDDDQHTREGWAEFFNGVGYRVAQAADGEEALRKMEDRIPDLAIIDVGMPRVDGMQLTRRVREHPRWRHLPVVALTGLDYPDTLERITAVGCDAYLSKPCEPQRLLAVVRGLLLRRNA